MLASIHPLGERARRQRWGVTVAAYLAGTLVAAAAVGALLGAAGGWLGLPGSLPAAGPALAAVALAGVALDLGVGGLAVPTIHRQVDEHWLELYRGWVYGAGYGVQLGLGVVTVVNSFTVYLALLLALAAGSGPAGLAIGGAFGAARGLVVFATADVRDPDHLRRLHRRLQSWDPASKRLAVAVQAGAAAVLVAAWLG